MICIGYVRQGQGEWTLREMGIRGAEEEKNRGEWIGMALKGGQYVDERRWR